MVWLIIKIEIFPVNNQLNRLAKNTTGSTEKLKFQSFGWDILTGPTGY